jgi:5'(3')-deoxyribonucleotidase
MKRIAIDMDEVIADIQPKFLAIFEQLQGRRPAPEEYRGRKLYELSGGENIRTNLFDKGFFADLPVMEGSQDAVKSLMEHYEIFIVSAAQEFRNSLEDKHDWLQQHFPFIHWKNYVFCGDKSLIGVDYLIDDHAFNLETFRGKGLLYTAAHNVHEKRFTRLNNWAEVLAFFENERAQEA